MCQLLICSDTDSSLLRIVLSDRQELYSYVLLLSFVLFELHRGFLSYFRGIVEGGEWGPGPLHFLESIYLLSYVRVFSLLKVTLKTAVTK